MPPRSPAAAPLYISFSARCDPSPCRSLVEVISNAVNRDCKEVHLLLRSHGGYVEEAISLYNTLRAFPVRLVAHNTYAVESMALVVFLAADERYATPGSTFLLHQTSSGPNGGLNRDAVQHLAKDMIDLDRRVVEIVSQRTTTDYGDVDAWVNEGRAFSADEALARGVISSVAELSIPARHEMVVIDG